MQRTKNPLRVHFRVASLILFCELLNICLKFIRANGSSGGFVSGWSIVHKAVALIGLGTFIWFYIRNKMWAWYTLSTMFAVILPLLFLMDIPIAENARVSRTQLLTLLVGFWVFIFSDLLIKYRSYRAYITDMS